MFTEVTYPLHPAIECFPLMSEQQFKGLKQDIQEHGQLESITIWKGMLVDGRARLRACNELKIDAKVGVLDDDVDPVTYCTSLNLHRHGMSKAERSKIVKELASTPNY